MHRTSFVSWSLSSEPGSFSAWLTWLFFGSLHFLVKFLFNLLKKNVSPPAKSDTIQHPFNRSVLQNSLFKRTTSSALGLFISILFPSWLLCSWGVKNSFVFQASNSRNCARSCVLVKTQLALLFLSPVLFLSLMLLLSFTSSSSSLHLRLLISPIGCWEMN